MTSNCSAPTTPTIGSRRPLVSEEHLHQPFFFELAQPLVELLVPGVLQPHASEVFRGKPRHVRKSHRRPRVDRVADGKLPGVREADDVAGVGFVRSSRDRVRRSGRRGSRGCVLRARPLTTGMSFTNRPEQTRTNATRSRWRGSMFACILKTKPVKRSSVGEIGPTSLDRGCGGGASSTSARRNGSRPKLVSALPKNTGV